MSAILHNYATDREIQEALGQRLRALREARGLSQQEAAERADLARSTVHEAEAGKNPTLNTLVRLLRVYGRLGALDTFIPEPTISPMERLRERKAKQEGEASG